MTNLNIQKEIFAQFDHPTIGMIIAKRVSNQGKSDEVNNLLRSAEMKIRQDFSKLESHGLHPNIIA